MILCLEEHEIKYIGRSFSNMLRAGGQSRDIVVMAGLRLDLNPDETNPVGTVRWVELRPFAH
jgi:hypothetical protein